MVVSSIALEPTPHCSSFCEQLNAGMLSTRETDRPHTPLKLEHERHGILWQWQATRSGRPE